jgi:hypothetical protein
LGIWPPLVAGIGPTTTFHASVGVLVVVGWSLVMLLLEGLSVVFIVPAFFFHLVDEAPDGFVVALALEDWLR